ncbi:MAG: M48 family metalloprotease [Thaumarchaeota archaeon]|nr:M48 family metalloprotease [Nitrososphaerota archaeon]MCZ6724751.1 M48 family metalloprotease [Nitrososphaerota archaeon]
MSSQEFLRGIDFKIHDNRIKNLILQTLDNMPPDGLDISSLESIQLSDLSPTETLAALTTHSSFDVTIRNDEGNEWDEIRSRQKITFYLDILNNLSDLAVKAIIAHEIAHAWLNEHVKPESSQQREKDSDDLARKWGFTEELLELENETD